MSARAVYDQGTEQLRLQALDVTAWHGNSGWVRGVVYGRLDQVWRACCKARGAAPTDAAPPAKMDRSRREF